MRKFNIYATIIIGTILFCVIVANINVYSFIKDNSENIFNNDNSDIGLQEAELNNKVMHTNAVSVSHGLKVVARSVVTDGVRTVINIRIEGKNLKNGIPSILKMVLNDDLGTEYVLSQWGQGLKRNSSDFYETNVIFSGSPQKSTRLHLKLTEINDVKGSWNLGIPVTPTPLLTFNVDSENDEVKITKVIYSSTYTILEGNDINFSPDPNGPGRLAKLTDGNKEVNLIEAKSEFGHLTLYFPPLKPSKMLTLKRTISKTNKVLYTLDILIK